MTREEAIKDIEENILPIVGGKSLRMAIDALRQPERKTGKWIDDDGNAATDKYCATCSACGEWSEYLTAYCPNCGADMREPEDMPMEYFESGGR